MTTGLRIDTAKGTNETVVPPVVSTGRAEIIQRAIIRLEVFVNEWPFDNQAGVDWLRFDSKQPDANEIGAALVRELEKIDGLDTVTITVNSIESYDVELTFENYVESETLTATLGGTVNAS